VQEQNYDAGAADLSQAAKMGLSDPVTYNFLGICYSRLGRLPEAVESYQKALTADPKLAQAHLNRGFAYERMNDSARAKEEYQEACRGDQRLCALLSGRNR
jgi:Tfp pilus assembly protein PilF